MERLVAAHPKAKGVTHEDLFGPLAFRKRYRPSALMFPFLAGPSRLVFLGK
jgi:hypothetical protein